jgi:choline dehydrogenase-like flavoprotein
LLIRADHELSLTGGVRAEKIINAMKSFGIPTALDGTSGHALGAFWVLNTLDPRNQTRSYARPAYHDPASKRPNYHLITQRQVTKIIFDNYGPNSQYLPREMGVSYSIGRNESISRVLAKKEVILAAGAIHTPRLLRLSGIGYSRLLRSVGIEPVVDLPGVGQNFQDHAVIYGPKYNVTLADEFNHALQMKDQANLALY